MTWQQRPLPFCAAALCSEQRPCVLAKTHGLFEERLERGRWVIVVPEQCVNS